MKAIRPLHKDDLVLGQYRRYRSLPGVKPDSTVETYVALRLFVDSWRWAGVPVYIRARGADGPWRNPKPPAE